MAENFPKKLSDPAKNSNMENNLKKMYIAKSVITVSQGIVIDNIL